ncbi:hypothetical protein MRX96_034174 [Rhipicephalus microplus]
MGTERTTAAPSKLSEPGAAVATATTASDVPGNSHTVIQSPPIARGNVRGEFYSVNLFSSGLHRDRHVVSLHMPASSPQHHMPASSVATSDTTTEQNGGGSLRFSDPSPTLPQPGHGSQLVLGA